MEILFVSESCIVNYVDTGTAAYYRREYKDPRDVYWYQSFLFDNDDNQVDKKTSDELERLFQEYMDTKESGNG